MPRRQSWSTPTPRPVDPENKKLKMWNPKYSYVRHEGSEITYAKLKYDSGTDLTWTSSVWASRYAY